MVDALRAAHRVLRPGGMLVDARPDGERPPRAIAEGRVRGTLLTFDEVHGDDLAADQAVATVIGQGLFQRVRAGRVWYAATFHDLRDLEEYVASSSRYSALSPGTRAALLPYRLEPIATRRALRWQVLRKA